MNGIDIMFLFGYNSDEGGGEVIGNRIREARKAKKMTQEDLAEKIGVKRSVISKYETGLIEPPINQIRKIADALNVPDYYLLEFKKIGKTPDGTDIWDREENFNNPEWTKGAALITMIGLLDRLNFSGQQKAIERVEELTEIPKYQRKPEEGEPGAADPNQNKE